MMSQEQEIERLRLALEASEKERKEWQEANAIWATEFAMLAKKSRRFEKDLQLAEYKLSLVSDPPQERAMSELSDGEQDTCCRCGCKPAMSADVITCLRCGGSYCLTCAEKHNCRARLPVLMGELAQLRLALAAAEEQLRVERWKHRAKINSRCYQFGDMFIFQRKDEPSWRIMRCEVGAEINKQGPFPTLDAAISAARAAGWDLGEEEHQ